jgi:hypothetical protein
VSKDEDTKHILYNRQIQDALLSLAQGGKKLDIVAFDACLMDMLETAYALRDTASFMVASEETEPASGWQYEKWAGPLVANPAMLPKDLATSIVRAYKDQYQSYDQTTLANIDLAAIPQAANALGEFAAALSAKLDSQRAALGSARGTLLAFGSTSGVRGNGSIDLQAFLEAFASATTDSDLRTLADRARQAVHQAVVEDYASARMTRKWSPHGIAIYLPPTAGDFRADSNSSAYFKSNTKYPIEFVETNDWSTVVTNYLGVTPPH